MTWLVALGGLVAGAPQAAALEVGDGSDSTEYWRGVSAYWDDGDVSVSVWGSIEQGEDGPYAWVGAFRSVCSEDPGPPGEPVPADVTEPTEEPGQPEEPVLVPPDDGSEGGGCSGEFFGSEVPTDSLEIDLEAGKAVIEAQMEGCSVDVQLTATGDTETYESGGGLPEPRYEDRLELRERREVSEYRPAEGEGGVCDWAEAAGPSDGASMQRYSERSDYLYVDPS